MKILMITEKDAANASLSLIAEAFCRKGHEVDIYAPFYSENVLRDFKKLNKVIHQFSEITETLIEKYDFIFSSVFSVKWLYNKGLFGIKKFIFTHDYLLHGEMTYGADFSFATSIHNTASPWQGLLDYGKMGIGEPKYDSLIHLKGESNSNRLLFIDSGHYPFGDEGRLELARSLLHICKQYPEYELWVKPRFLPTDDIITHYNRTHLYDVIFHVSGGRLPDNMVLLKEHKNLQELINQSRTVICMYTTAYISASLANKGLIILEGLPNDDCFDQRNKRKLIFRDRMRSSGALVNYKHICDVLPDGIKCSKEHMDEYLMQKEHVAEKIVEVTAYIFTKYLQFGKFPENTHYRYCAGCHNIQERKGATWECILSDRFENYLKYRVLISFDYRVDADVDVQSILRPIQGQRDQGYISYDIFKAMMRKIDDIVFEGVISNRERLMLDSIDQGILLHAYFWKKKYKELISFPNQSLGAYNYFVGRLYYGKGDTEQGISYLKKYVEISERFSYIKEISDMPDNKMYALKTLTNYFVQKKDGKEIEKYLNIWRRFYQAINPNMTELEKVKDSTSAYYLTCLKWYEAQLNGILKKNIEQKLSTKSIAVYGAGRVTRELILKNTKLMESVDVFIDQFTKCIELENLPVVRLEDRKMLADIDIILVTVAYDHENIQKAISELYPEKSILPIWILFN